MLDKIYSLYSKLFLNDNNYHKILAFSILLFIIIFVIILTTLEPVKHSEEYIRFKSKPAEEKTR